MREELYQHNITLQHWSTDTYHKLQSIHLHPFWTLTTGDGQQVAQLYKE